MTDAPDTSQPSQDTLQDTTREAARYISERVRVSPRVALVLGTGLGGVADAIQDPVAIAYADIPHFPRSTVLSHAGRLVLGTLHGVPVVAMQGRFHLYEGYTPRQIVFPVRVLRTLGADILLLTNAAGGIDPSYAAGMLMLVRDSIGLPMLAGFHPLIGPNDDWLGPRFPAMTGAYDVDLRRLAREVAAAAGIALAEGVYAMVAGPSYETPAELRFLRAVGADAVGMSTVPEVIAARHMGMRVLAVSCITNKALVESEPGNGAADGTHEVSHDAVVAQAEAAGPRLAAILSGVVARLSSSGS